MQTARHSPSASGTSYQLTDRQFAVIAKLAEEQFGLNLPASKKPLVLSRLSKRLRHLGLSAFDEYLELLSTPDLGPGETNSLLSSLTTNVTHFFRERHHFEMLERDILPGLIKTAQSGGRVRMWSAGCSSGQEAYCLAITILEACPNAPSLDIKILATDIDPVILDQAKGGVYTAADVPDRDRALFGKYFETSEDGQLTAGAAIRRLVSFGEINLIADWPVRGPFDVIFCRNVAIYFEKETQARLWDKFASVMRPGGQLFIGHSERITDPAANGFQPNGVTAYRCVGR